MQKLHLIRVSGTYISLDKSARYWNFFWSEFLVQTLLFNVGSYQNYSRPESPINIFLLISVPDTEIRPNQSLQYIYFLWLVCQIPKLLLIRVSGANITLDNRFPSKLHLTRVSEKYISLDRRAQYINYSWSEYPVHKFLLIIVPDTEINPDQRFCCKHYSWI